MNFLKHKHNVFCFIMCRMKRSSSAVDILKSRVMNRPGAANLPLANYACGATPIQPARPRQGSLPVSPTASTSVPPLVPVCVGPPAKRGRQDTMTSQKAESDVASGESFHTANSAVYYNPPDARALAEAHGLLERLECFPFPKLFSIKYRFSSIGCSSCS